MLHIKALAGVSVNFNYNAIPENEALDLCRQMRYSIIKFYDSPEGQEYFKNWQEKRRQREAQKGVKR